MIIVLRPGSSTLLHLVTTRLKNKDDHNEYENTASEMRHRRTICNDEQDIGNNYDDEEYNDDDSDDDDDDDIV